MYLRSEKVTVIFFMVTYFARQFAKDAVRWPWIEVRRVSGLQRQNVASEINCRVLVVFVS